jgi:hypothetical protein
VVPTSRDSNNSAAQPFGVPLRRRCILTDLPDWTVTDSRRRALPESLFFEASAQ